MAGPLAGLRVLELARILAGPWAGQILADLGADVIKVERKGAGDDTRGWGPPFVEAAEDGHLDSAYFHSTNRGKRSIELDFEGEDGRRIVKKLAARCDVLIENFKVGGLAKFGLDYASLSKAAMQSSRLIGDKLASGVWGIREPKPDALEVFPDILIVPLVAFDRAGFRLGYGAGYYDMTIARLRAMKRIVAIGIAYAAQEFDAVPKTARDEKLDLVLTEREIIDLRA